MFLSLLTVLFIGLKLTGYIAWSWVWVLSPLWIPLAIVIALFVITGLIGVIVGGTTNLYIRRKGK